MHDEEFINTFNECYPFERYIIKKPQSVNYLFDDIQLTEVFIPSTEIKPITYINKVTGKESFLCYNKVDDEAIYVKLRCNGNEFRMAFYDFGEGIRETIISIVIEDMGGLNWQSLFIDYGNGEDVELKEMLLKQRMLIIEKYGECNIKENFKIESTLKLL